MADEKKSGGGPVELALLLFGALAVLVVLWFVNGGPERADLKGLFLTPPAPLGTGESYGPQIGEPAPWAPTSTNQY